MHQAIEIRHAAERLTQDRSYNHIFDPATGRSSKALSSVTLLARTGVDADALSTAVSVLGVEKGLQLIKRWPGADGVSGDAGRITGVSP